MKFQKFISLFFFLSFCLTGNSPSVNPAHAGINEWTAIGPEGGNIRTLAIDPKTPEIIYATTEEGLFKSTDEGNRWTQVNTQMPPPYNSFSITAFPVLIIDPMDPRIIYSSTGDDVFKSTDAGVTWEIILSLGMGINGIAVHSINPNNIYAATNYGVYRSIDAGANWIYLNSGNVYIRTITIDPVNPSVIYATTTFGLFKSVDGGAAWNPIQNPKPYSSVRTLAINPVNPEIVYAGVECTGSFEQCGGVYRSADGGTTWNYSDITDGLDVSTLMIDPLNPSTLYVATYNKGVYKSTDAGVDWNPVSSGLTSTYVGSLIINPFNPSTVYAGVYGGVFKSTNGGSDWNVVHTGFPRLEINAISIDPANSANLYIGTKSGVFKTSDGGTTWNPANTGLLYAEVIGLTISPVDTRIVYAGSWLGLFKSIDQGIHWEIISPYNLVSFGDIVINPLEADVMYAGAAYRCDGCVYYNYFPTNPLLKSTDGGANWDVLHLPMESNGWSLAIDPVNPDVLFAGAYNSNTQEIGFFKTTDGGVNWSPTSLTDGYVDAIAIDPENPSTVYAAGGSHMHKSADGGNNWSTISTGLPYNTWVNAVAIDPLNPNNIYAGTSDGVFKSKYGGTNWAAINNGLTGLQVRTLVIDPVDPKTLYAGTSHGLFKISQVTASQPSNPSPQNGFSGGSAISALTWQACLYAESYDVFFGTLPDPPFVSTTTNTSYPLPGLSPNKTYYWKIVAKTSCGESTLGPIWSFRTAIPPPPTNIFASYGTYTDRVNVSWLASPGATSYKVYRAISPLSIKTALGSTANTTFDDITATPKKTYYYWVKALNGYGTSHFSSHDAGYRSDGSLPPAITVLSPNGVDNWAAGSTQTIRWTYTENFGPYVRIELLKGGVVNRTIKSFAWKGTGGTDSFNWRIPLNQAPGADYRIRVTSTTNDACTDTSDSDFTIAAPGITVVSPDSGETLTAGTTQTIRWTYTGNPGSYVKIELLKRGVVNHVIASSAWKGTGGSGSRSWKVPFIQAPGADYSIRVTSTNNNSYSDTSDSSFTINK